MNRWFDNLPYIGRKIPGKIILSFLMFLYAIILCLAFQRTDRFFCVLAMFFSFLGDIALNHRKEHSDQTRIDFLIGGVSFIIAHLFYCIAYYKKLTLKALLFMNFGSLFAVVLLCVITIVSILKANPKQKKSKLFLFGIIYLWLTGINYTTIFSYAYSMKNSIEALAFIGGIMFLGSDTIIGLEKFFGLKSKVARELVWWLYPIGQIILITLA